MALGFSRIRLAYTAGEAIGPDIFDFYRSLGINLKQLYGSTEASVFITIQPDGEIKGDTVGVPAPEVEIDIADNMLLPFTNRQVAATVRQLVRTAVSIFVTCKLVARIQSLYRMSGTRRSQRIWFIFAWRRIQT